jgi:hypothetical protein
MFNLKSISLYFEMRFVLFQSGFSIMYVQVGCVRPNRFEYSISETDEVFQQYLLCGIKLYNDQRNAQVLIYLSIYFYLTCFGVSFSPSSEAGVQLRQLFRSSGYGVSARAFDLNHCRSCTPASEDELKESLKHLRQK